MLLTKKANPFMPPRVVVYGPEGVGKSTMGARAGNPVFITPEGGADRLLTKEGKSVDYIPNVNDWDSLIAAIIAVRDQPHEFTSLVLDSADWIEGLCHKKIIGVSNKSITTVNGGYGAGYREAQAMHVKLIELLSQVREKRNMAIVITAHAHVKAVKDPEMMEDYDSYEIKCHEFVSSLWREWVDGLFFVRFRTFMANTDDTARARALTDGSRVLYTRKTPAFQAKNRYGMPAEMNFTEEFWDEFQTYFKAGTKPESAEEIYAECMELLSKVTDETLKASIEKFINDNKTDVNKLGGTRLRLKDITNSKE